jgi:hypothetical protein
MAEATATLQIVLTLIVLKSHYNIVVNNYKINYAINSHYNVIFIDFRPLFMYF